MITEASIVNAYLSNCSLAFAMPYPKPILKSKSLYAYFLKLIFKIISSAESEFFYPPIPLIFWMNPFGVPIGSEYNFDIKNVKLLMFIIIMQKYCKHPIKMISKVYQYN